MKISILIPNYNGEAILANNLPKILESVKNIKEDLEIIISDDNSTDSSVEVINNFISKNKSANIKLIENATNKGFASNINSAASEASGDFFVLLNTDVVPSVNFLDPVLPHFRDDNVFAVGCMDESVEKGKIIHRGRGKGRWLRGLLVHGAAKIENGNTLWVSGGSGVFRRSIWEELGGLDSLYDPFYWEDIDISYRARKSGYKTIFEKKSVVRHDHDKGVIKSKYKNKEIEKIAYRNQFIFAWKNSDLSNFLFGIIWFPYYFSYAILKEHSMLVGIFKAVLLLPRIIKQRLKVHKHFRLGDNQAVQIN